MRPYQRILLVLGAFTIAALLVYFFPKSKSYLPALPCSESVLDGPEKLYEETPIGLRWEEFERLVLLHEVHEKGPYTTARELSDEEKMYLRIPLYLKAWAWDVFVFPPEGNTHPPIGSDTLFVVFDQNQEILYKKFIRERFEEGKRKKDTREETKTMSGPEAESEDEIKM